MAEQSIDVVSKPRRALIGRLMVAGFMGSVIVGECLFAYFWIPSADHVAARVEERAEREKAQRELEMGAEEPDDKEQVVEVELGEYSITAHQPVSNTTLRIDFHLYATVLEKDQNEFQQFYANSQHRLRDTVIFEIRNAEVTDLTDAGLGLIKRRILAKSNRLFGRPLLRTIIFSNYSFYEQ